MNVAPEVLAAIGHTPLLRLRLPDVPDGVELWIKCEWHNPGGSVKDRTAFGIVTEGIRSGRLRSGKTIVDSSSGNTLQQKAAPLRPANLVSIVSAITGGSRS